MDGTIAVITGAGSGMGRACAERLRGAVDMLVAVDLRETDVEGDATGVACDVADAAAVAGLVEQIGASGSLRILVNAAWISPTMGTPVATEYPVATVTKVPVAEVLQHLPAGTAVLSLEERTTLLHHRRTGAQLRQIW